MAVSFAPHQAIGAHEPFQLSHGII